MDGLAKGGAEGKIGHEVRVHYIEMQQAHLIPLQHQPNVLSQVQQIGRQQRRR